MLDANPQLLNLAFDSMLMHLRLQKTQSGASREWQPLADDLHRLGLDKRVTDAWVSWAYSQDAAPMPLRIRLLHPMERELITLEAFNDLLELVKLGVIHPMQMENILENCPFLPTLPAGREQVRALALRIFAEQFQAQGYGPSH